MSLIPEGRTCVLEHLLCMCCVTSGAASEQLPKLGSAASAIQALQSTLASISA